MKYIISRRSSPRFGEALLLLATLLLFCGNALAQAPPTVFTPLGFLPGGYTESGAYGVSADGSVVVGYSQSANGTEAFRWTVADNRMVGLGGLPGGIFYSFASDVSADGSVVVGRSRGVGGNSQAFRWTAANNQMVGLGDLPGGGIYSEGHAVSADGLVVVGYSLSSKGAEVFRWTSQTGIVGLPGWAGDSSNASDVSADGSAIVGYMLPVPGTQEPFRWTPQTGLVGLGTLPGTSFGSATAISANGSTIIGTCYGSFSGPNEQSFVWTSSRGMVSFGTLTGDSSSRATAVSGDGSVILGNIRNGIVTEPILWSAQTGIVRLKQHLMENYASSLPADFNAWQLSPTALSADGTTIVGSGTDPRGRSQAWRIKIARISSPGGSISFKAGPLGVGLPPTEVKPSVRPRYLDANGNLYNLTPSVFPSLVQVEVKNASGVAQAGARVRVRISGDNSAAGHVPSKHTGGSAHGWLSLITETPVDDFGITINMQTAVAKGDRGGSFYESGSNRRSILILFTDGDGLAQFSYIPPEVAGTDKITVDLPDVPTATPATADIKVKQGNFVELTEATDATYTLVGRTDSHMQNHFGTVQTKSTLQAIADRYRLYQTQATGNATQAALFVQLTRAITALNTYDLGGYRYFDAQNPVKKASNVPLPLGINDMSLAFGGLFDIAGDFAAPHGGHRNGNQVDIQTANLMTILKIVGGNVDTSTLNAVGHPNILPATNPRASSINPKVDSGVKAVNCYRAALLVLAIKDEGGYIISEGSNSHFHVNLPQ